MSGRKLRYVPGLISLIGLPIILFIYPVEDPPSEKVVLRFNLPASDNSTVNTTFTDNWVQTQMKKKTVTRITLDNFEYNTEEEKGFYKAAKFDLISREMQRLSFVGDSSIVLQVEFGSDNTYGDWVKLVNLATIYHLSRYTFTDNSFYFLGNIPVQRPEPIILAPIEVEPVVFDAEPWAPPTKWELFIYRISWEWRELRYALKDNLKVVIGFIALIIVPWLFWLRGNFQRRQIIVR